FTHNTSINNITTPSLHDALPILNNFVNQIKDLEYVISKENKSINIEIKGNNSSKLIGYRGETIKALQTIISAIGNKNVGNRVKVDRKSTRLNSSHVSISYAVFCL